MTLRDAQVGSTVVVTKIEGDSAYKRGLWIWESPKEANFTSEKLLRWEIRYRSLSEAMS